MKDNNKPWLDDKGQPLPDEQIKVVCQNWNPQIWEDYLSTIEGKQTELLLDNPTLIESFSQDDYNKSISNLVDKKDFPNLKAFFSEVLKRLPSNQHLVLHHIFWENMSIQNIAQEMGASRQSVEATRDRAFKKLSRALLQAISKDSQKDIKSENLAS